MNASNLANLASSRSVALLLAILVGAPLACSSSDASSAAPSDGGAGDDAEVDAGGDAAEAAVPPPDPTPTSIEFHAVSKLPSGEQILHNDWNSPNSVVSLTPDGATKTVIFTSRRVWSMGVARGGAQIAFSSEDPYAQARYGVTISDAIQQTWLYDDASQTVQFFGVGNVNDECHSFGPGDALLWVCRRYDFADDGSFKGWRIGRFDVAAKTFEFVTPETGPRDYAMGPHVTSDGSTLFYFTLQVTPPSTQTYRIMKRALPSGTPEVVRENAGRLSLSADDTKMVYLDYAASGAIYVAPVSGGGAPVKVADKGGDPVFSPDGTKVAFLADDAASNCAHIDVVHADGSDAATPTRIHDCKVAGDFITQIAWITR